VEIQDGGSTEWRAAAPGDTVGKNAVISTGFRSTALIALGDSRLSVRPLTRLRLEELVRRDTAEEVSLRLRTGRVRADVRPPVGGRTDFTVRSPIATASVRGTSFEFDTRHLYVNDGRVLLEGGNGQTVYVDKGQRSYVDESEQRVIPPFEAEAALLTSTLAELTNTGSDTGGYAPVITVSEVNLSPVSIEAEW
jgi:ferric-dicitrate binding protein FerR (iron transport regulator)